MVNRKNILIKNVLFSFSITLIFLSFIMWLSSSPIYFSLGVLFSIITVLFDIVFDDFNWSALFLAFTLICFLLLIIFSVILSCFKNQNGL